MESGKVDRNKVSLATEVEELYWTARLGATREAIVTAVRNAGTNPEAAAKWLRVNRLCHERPPSPAQASVPRSR
jgi:hypothetical protein